MSCALLKNLIETRNPGEDILVVSRYNSRWRRLALEFPKAPDMRVRFMSIHKAKGTEADFVVLLGCFSGRSGFPSEIVEQGLLDIVQKNKSDKSSKLEEERRLFYVAMTRCRKRLFLFTSSSAKSTFVKELDMWFATTSQRE